jgi:hypothetical protein
MDHDSLRFYWTVACGSTRKAIRVASNPDDEADEWATIDLEPSDVPEPEYAMVSHATKNNIPFEGPEWMIDSGGYSTLASNPEYESSVDDYVDYLEKYEERISRYVLRDWACEPDLLREWDRDVRQHQNWTIRDHVACREQVAARGLDMEPVAVLQGYELSDYLYHFEYLREHGLLTDHLGIGSICRRGQEDEMQSLLLQLRQEIPDRITLHGFGVKKTVLEDPDVVDALDTVDSNAWENRVSRNPHTPNGWEPTLRAYVDYREDLRDRLEIAANSDGGIQVFSLGEWTTTSSVPEDIYPLVECVCGTLLDPNDLERNEAACRHCERWLLNQQMQALTEPTDTSGDMGKQSPSSRTVSKTSPASS